MNKIAVIIGLLFFVYDGLSQQNPKLEQKKDSIQQLINVTSGISEKIDKYKEAFQFFSRSNPPFAHDFAQKGFDFAYQNREFKHQLEFCNNIAQTYVMRRDYEQGLAYYNEGLHIAKEHKLKEDFLVIKHHIASVWLKQGKKDEAAQLLDSIIQVTVKEKLLKIEGMAVVEMGKIERTNGNYDKSLAYFKRNLEIAEEYKNLDQISYALLHIAIDYGITKEDQKAIEINRRGLKICLQDNNYRRANFFNNNLAVCYRNLKQYDSAFYYHKIVLQQSKQEQNPYVLARVYMNMAATYSAAKEYEQATAYYDSAYQLVKDNKGDLLTASIFHNLSSLYQEQKKYHKSIEYANIALETAIQKGITNELANLYENLYKSYKSLNQTDSALFYHEKMTQANDSIYSIEKYNSTEHIKREIESAKNQEEIGQLHFNQKRDKLILFSATGAFLSFLIIAFLVIRNLKRKKELAEEHQKLEEQKVLVLIQEQEINAVNSMIKGQEKERQKISDELHDNLGSSLATLKLHTENLLNNKKLNEEKKTEILRKTCDILDDTYQKVRNMAHVKSTGMVAQKGLILALEKLSQQISSKGNIDVSIDVFGFEKIASNPLKILLYNTIQELLTNAIKHSKASQINIQITQHENELNVLVEDNGSGFNYSEKSLENGMGLYNIKNKIEHLKGTFNVDSILGHGTTININIPI